MAKCAVQMSYVDQYIVSNTNFKVNELWIEHVFLIAFDMEHFLFESMRN